MYVGGGGTAAPATVFKWQLQIRLFGVYYTGLYHMRLQMYWCFCHDPFIVLLNLCGEFYHEIDYTTCSLFVFLRQTTRILSGLL